MYTDIALLTPIPDLWTRYGVQTEPFPGPGPLAVPYTSLVWEAIHKHGGGCDYTSERVIAGSTVENGKLCYGPKQYGTLFLVGIEGIEPATLEKLHTFVQQGGRIFCIERYPSKSLGFVDYERRDREVRDWVEKLKGYPERFILLEQPLRLRPRIGTEHRVPAGQGAEKHRRDGRRADRLPRPPDRL